jgi:hypothetical protein
MNNPVHFFIYHEAGQKLLGGSLNCRDEGRDGLDGLFANDLTLEDIFTDQHQGRIGAREHQGIDDDLAEKINKGRLTTGRKQKQSDFIRDYDYFEVLNSLVSQT